MRIGIIGNYGNNNNGDEAILLGLLTQLVHHLHINRDDIVVFSHNPEDTTKRYGVRAERLLYKKNKRPSFFHTFKQYWNVIRHIDVLIIGGGGLLMDMYKRDAPLYGVLGILARYAGCRVVIYGVGAGPIQTTIGRFFIRQLLKCACSISVRDDDSKHLLRRIGIKKPIDVIGDPAFYVPISSPRQKSSDIRRVAVTAVPYFSHKYWPIYDQNKYSEYIQGMADSLDELIEHVDVDVTFFSTKFPQDVEVTRHIIERMQHVHRVKIVDDHLHPQDIIDICMDHDIVIGTRLHSLILSVLSHTPIIGIGYHHKVFHFMKMIGEESYFLPISELQQKDRLLYAVREMQREWIDIQERICKRAEEMKKEASKGIEQLRKVIGNESS